MQLIGELQVVVVCECWSVPDWARFCQIGSHFGLEILMSLHASIHVVNSLAVSTI